MCHGSRITWARIGRGFTTHYVQARQLVIALLEEVSRSNSLNAFDIDGPLCILLPIHLGQKADPWYCITLSGHPHMHMNNCQVELRLNKKPFNYLIIIDVEFVSMKCIYCEKHFVPTVVTENILRLQTNYRQ